MYLPSMYSHCIVAKVDLTFCYGYFIRCDLISSNSLTGDLF
jgi:hypothetical protein